MTEKRVIIGHGSHSAQGPHLPMPAGFVPLRLRVEAERVTIEVACSLAVIGRHTDTDIRLAYPDVSRHHCQLRFEDGQWRVQDLNSVNGIRVNNEPTAQATLYAGDLLRVGCVPLLVLSATPVRLTKSQAEQNDKLRQIAEVLPD
jgi:pSer/pThr/pTyr-binding forkhead associated (FHA) protein